MTLILCCLNPKCSAIPIYRQPRRLTNMAELSYGLCEQCLNPFGRIDESAMEAIQLDVPFSLTCAHCDAFIDTPHEALLAGWQGITADLEGLSWNFIGDCPECKRNPSPVPAHRRFHESPVRPSFASLH